MEYCFNYDVSDLLDPLLLSLRLLHSLHIIHGDVKPENTMWSPKFNKPVFIDFGLTKILS